MSLIEKVRKRGRFFTKFEGETMTKGSFKDSLDINRIMARYRKTGQLPPGRQGRFEDLGPPIDYQEAVQTVLDANQAFMDLPAAVRDRFGNDPTQILYFLADEQNRPEAERMGLVKKKEEPPGPPEAVGGTAASSTAKPGAQ